MTPEERAEIRAFAVDGRAHPADTLALLAALDVCEAERDAAVVQFNAWEEERDRADAEEERAEKAEAERDRAVELLRQWVEFDPYSLFDTEAFLVATEERRLAEYHAWQRANEAPTVYSGPGVATEERT